MKKAFGLSKYHGDHKGLDAAIVKATKCEHVLPKEKHIRTIFQSLSPSKPRTEVIYCIHGLMKRLSQTNNWVVALKTLIIVHRALRELDTSIWVEFVNYAKVRGYVIDLSIFHYNSIANDYFAWVRNYALYLEERLQCFAVIKYDVVTLNSRYSPMIDNKSLLEQLPPLQNLLFRLLDCKPRDIITYNRLVQQALSIVAGESVKLYVAITVRVVELLDKFFEMHRSDANNALQIYQQSISQAERLSDFFETCKSLEFGRGQKFVAIKKPPASFLVTMEEYINEAPSSLMIEYNMDSDRKVVDNEGLVGELLSIDNTEDDKGNLRESSAENNTTCTQPQAAELMGLYDLLTGASEFDENSLALTIVPTDNANINNDESGANPITGWEVALFEDSENSNENIAVETTSNEKVGEIEASKLDYLYNEAFDESQQREIHQSGQVPFNPFDLEANGDTHMAMEPSNTQNEFCAFPNMASPISAQTEGMPYPNYYMMSQQQEQCKPLTVTKKSTNPFDETNVFPSSLPTDSTHST